MVVGGGNMRWCLMDNGGSEGYCIGVEEVYVADDGWQWLLIVVEVVATSVGPLKHIGHSC